MTKLKILFILNVQYNSQHVLNYLHKRNTSSLFEEKSSINYFLNIINKDDTIHYPLLIV